MKIAVTGASGFLGSWVSRILSQNHEVLAVLRNESSSYRLGGVAPLKVIRADVLEWPEEINRFSPDAFISMDWWGVVGEDRNETSQSQNVVRIQELLNRLNPISLIVGVGSQAELGPVPNIILENQPDNPTTLYGEAKVQTRRVFEEYSRETESRHVWARIFSTYGPLDSDRWLIPSTILALARRERVQMTKGEQMWSFLHAFDLAEAFRVIVESKDISGPVNVGNPETIQIRQLCLQIASLTGRADLLDFGSLSYRRDQVFNLQPACDTLLNSGWKPKVSIEVGLQHLYSWMVEGKNHPIALRDGSECWQNLPIRF